MRTSYGDAATVIAGGTFVGILINQRLLAPSALLALHRVPELKGITFDRQLRIGATTTHREIERSVLIQAQCPVLASTFSLVASPRIRTRATIGGVLADADYASDPPAMLHALNATVIARNETGARVIAVEDLITGYYETVLRPDELITEIQVAPTSRGVYRKFRSRSSEDRPCVAVAAAYHEGERGDVLKVVVGAVAERPQYFPAICALATGESMTRELATEIGQRYSQEIDPIADARGSASYRRRIIAVEVRRALETLAQQKPPGTSDTGVDERGNDWKRKGRDDA